MKNVNRNIRVLVENSATLDGLNIYLDFSGQREYLIFHRRNGFLYHLLKDGMPLQELRRWKVSTMTRSTDRRRRPRRSVVMDNAIKHLLAVIDSYLLERSAPLELEQYSASIPKFPQAA